MRVDVSEAFYHRCSSENFVQNTSLREPSSSPPVRIMLHEAGCLRLLTPTRGAREIIATPGENFIL